MQNNAVYFTRTFILYISMIHWEQLFKTFGFSESASKLYLAALELGPSSVQDIAKKIKVSRMTAYTLIEGLMKEGLMSTLQRGKKKMYVAESPDRLVSFMQVRMKTMEGTLKEVEHAVGQLKLIERGEKPIVKMFEGEEGIRAILDDILQGENQTINEIGNIDAMRNLFSTESLKPLKQELDKRKITTHAIYAIAKEQLTPRQSTKVKFYTEKEPSFFGNVTLYGNKVAFMTFRGKIIGVVIESEEIANTMREVFKLAWTSSKVNQ